jgi:hypothetical protein
LIYGFPYTTVAAEQYVEDVVLGTIELLVLLSVRRLSRDARCANIVQLLSVCKFPRKIEQIYVTLQKLEKQGLLSSISMPAPSRAKGRDVFSLTEQGSNEVAKHLEAIDRLRP